MLRSLLPVYRAITSVVIGDGASTSFWHDVWNGDDPLADTFPELYSHCQMKEMTVQQALEGAIHGSLVPRRSQAATQQLSQVSELLQQQQFSTSKDCWQSLLCKRNGGLDTSMLYKTLKTANSSQDPWANFVWKNKAPPRVRFFAWLLSQGRIQCKTNLIKKRIVDNTVCDVCHAAEETPAHIIFGCTAARQFWDAVQIQTQADWPIQILQEIARPGHIPSKHFGTFLMLCCWHIWKRRNNTVFRDDRTTLSATLSSRKSEAALWKARLPKKDKEVADACCSILATTM
jgi:hypothetical protein